MGEKTIVGILPNYYVHVLDLVSVPVDSSRLRVVLGLQIVSLPPFRAAVSSRVYVGALGHVYQFQLYSVWCAAVK